MNIQSARRHGRLWKVGLVVSAVLAASTAGVIVASAAAPPSAATIVGAGDSRAIPNSFIVVFKPTVSMDVAGTTRSLATQYKLQVRHVYTAALHGFAASMSSAQARQLALRSDVSYVQANHTVRINGVQPNPPSWGLDRIDQRSLPLDNSYTYASDGAGVHAYIIDTGIHLSHADFGGRATTGIDEVTLGGTAEDCDGHGTHVAGTVGGSSKGVAKGVALVAVRVLDCTGSGSTADVVAGVDWVTTHAIKPAVANMSLGSDADPTLDTALSNSIASGVTYAVAAGNSAADACSFSPARVAAAITVAATDTNDNRADFSNYGSCVDIFAPGVGITSDWNTTNTATQVISGTSMASPHVAGAAALVLAANPTFTPSQVSASLTSSATPTQVVNRNGSPNLLLYTGSTATPPPATNNFDLAATPSPVVVAAGHSATTTVQTVVDSGSPQTVALSASGLPSGVTAAFSPSSVSTGGTSTLTLIAASGTAAGHYSVVVTAVGTVTHSLTLPLIVSTNKGTYYPLAPQRILDTRTGNGAPAAQVGSGATINLQVTGRGGVPASGVSAVVLNVTSTASTGYSYVTVYPGGVPRPTASSLNMTPGWTGANSVTVAVGVNGQVNLFNNNGSTQLIADVVGYYAADASMVDQSGVGGEYQPVLPERLFDSRDPSFGHKLPAFSSAEISVSYGPDADPHIRALVVNVTSVNATRGGYLATWDGSGTPPETSTLNFEATGAAVPNMAVVPVSTVSGFPTIGVYTNATTDVIVDIMGFIDDSALGFGLRFTPQTPVRIADTRIGQGAPRLGPGVTATITAPAAVAPAGTEGLALNVTAVTPTGYTYVSVWPAGIPGLGQPFVSNLNLSPGQSLPNSVYTLIGPTQAFNVYNNNGMTDVLADVVGTFWDPTVVAAGTSAKRAPAPLSGQQLWQLTRIQPAARQVR